MGSMDYEVIIAMHYYQHNIGDFDKATRHLTRLERSIYRDLIELYYDTEMQLNADIKHLCRKVLANSNEEATAVEQVLNEFFTKTPDGWYHDRCEEEIERFKSNISQRAEAGRKSAAVRQQKRQRALNGRSTGEQQSSNDAPTNQEPLTINQEPLIKDKSAKVELDFSSWPQQPSPEILSAWLAMRKKVKATNSQLAMNTIGNELAKILPYGFSVDYCLSTAEASGWKGIKFEYFVKAGGQQFTQRPSKHDLTNKNYQGGEL
jgi:uncharacterized protein YdaU (DUF1376 family)